MPADRYDATCAEAGVRKPSLNETAMGERWRCGLRYGDLGAADDAPERRQNASARRPTRMRLMSGRPPAVNDEIPAQFELRTGYLIERCPGRSTTGKASEWVCGLAAWVTS